MLVINDLHIGGIRAAGTTPATALALREYGLKNFESILGTADEDLIIQGDMFDSYSVPMGDLLKSYQLLESWLTKGHRLVLIEGNHDLSRDSSKLGSFQFLGGLLKEHPQVQYVHGAAWIAESVYAIGHVTNQDEIDLELSRVPECKYLLLHCNFDNHFAVESDHSLNVCVRQASNCKAETLVFAHEHNHRTALGGKVFILGNQFPTSVSDCLSPQDKYMHRLTEEGVERIKTWDRAANYAEIDWKNPAASDAKFIRFVGTATSEEAAAVAETISRYRRASEAYVVSNAVRIGSNDPMDEFTVESLEQARSFDVMGALKKFLTEDEYAILEKLA